MANLTTRPYNRKDQVEFNRGFARGNYASAYETEDYGATQKDLIGQNGFYRIGHLLGFFSSFELDEIPDVLIYSVPLRDEVEHYRAEFEREGWI